jgi:hypothetical protein
MLVAMCAQRARVAREVSKTLRMNVRRLEPHFLEAALMM